MVIENMLGYELVRNEQHERPLGRTVEEVKLIMKQLPKNVYSAIDMNHIDNPGYGQTIKICSHRRR